MFFPIVEAIHVMGLSLSVGTIVLVDLWTLGWSERSPTNLARWTWAGFAVMLLSGGVLFLSNMHRYLSNPGFLAKMLLLAAALLVHFTLHRKKTRVAAILSLILWTSVVISAKLIADLDA